MKSSRNAGYSLVELAAVIGIIAVVLGMSLTAGNMQIKMAENTGTQDNLMTVKTALNLFQKKNGRYPCPARPNVGPTNAAYGAEAVCSPICVAGLVCDTADNAVIGTLPFKTLQLGEQLSYDKWDSRLTYAVDLGHVKTSAHNNGTLRVVDKAGNDILNSPIQDRAIFVVVSHGPNKAGAYAKDGTMPVPCGAAGARLDVENCDRSNDIFRDAPANQGDVATNYDDDQIVWQTQPAPLIAGMFDSNGNKVAGAAGRTPGNPVVSSEIPQISLGIDEGYMVSGRYDHRISVWGSVWGIGAYQDLYGYSGMYGAKFKSFSGSFWGDCGLTVNGIAYCKGSNYYGEDGTGDNTMSIMGAYSGTTAVVDNHVWSQISTSGQSGGTTCGVDTAGDVWCWGMRSMQALGSDQGGSYDTRPVHVNTGTTKMRTLSLGPSYKRVTAIDTTGKAWSWGGQSGTNPSFNAALGVGDASDHWSVTAVATASDGTAIFNWSKITQGSSHACGVTLAGKAYCWGVNGDAQLGNGSTVDSTVPSLVIGGYSDWVDVQPANKATCGLRNKRIYCWGNGNTALGAPIIVKGSPASQEVAGNITDWIGLSVDGSQFGITACAVRSNYTVWCWGYNGGAFGTGYGGPSSYTPIRVPGISY